MKKAILILSAIFLSSYSFAQDSVKVQRDNDTIRIGGMIILRKGNPGDSKRVVVTVGERNPKKENQFISTSTSILDIGFANLVDNTNYTQAAANGTIINKPGGTNLSANDMKLKTIKSVNINLWFFMQKMNLVKHNINLKYGLGLELNNYRFTSSVSFKDGGPNPYNSAQIVPNSYIFRDSISFSKNKLAADYITVPLMLNFRTNPENPKKSIGLSAGVSMGYLYSGRNKQVSSDRGKHKNRGDYDLEKWKFAYIGELALGPVNLYGSYSPKSIFKNDLNFTPYSIGIRLSNW